MKKPKRWLGWHFLADTGKTRDGKKVCVSQTLEVKGPLELCRHGLHASKRAIDALAYAPGPIICHVELSGEIVNGDDKACASQRRCLAKADATLVLHEFACWCAGRSLRAERKAGREPDTRSWAAIAAKRKWLSGEISDAELDAARAAAMAAARAAERAAAMAAARAAAEAAERAAARAARAARAAARAAMAAAEAAERAAAQNRKLESMLRKLLRPTKRKG
jgi:hypothetical protein